MGHTEPCFIQFAILSIVERTYSTSVGIGTRGRNVNTCHPCCWDARDYIGSISVEQLKWLGRLLVDSLNFVPADA